MTTLGQLRSLAVRVQRRIERVALSTGRTVVCPYCTWTGWRFLPAGARRTPNRLCPGCGSLERYRMIPLVFDRELAGRRDVRVLEIAPKRCLTDHCRGRGWRYVSSDLSSPTAMVRADLRRMPIADASFDAIVCMHVMEHIIDDAPAFAELGRLLAPGGILVICVPIGEGPTREGAPERDWERLYGQHDHVRLYGMDVVDRMTTAGLRVEVVDTHAYFGAGTLARHGLRGDDRYLFMVRK